MSALEKVIYIADAIEPNRNYPGVEEIRQAAEEDLDKVWIKFYKVDKARTREYGGNGIGLSIVKAIMDSFHQRCGVVNEEDGVRFWFELDNRVDDGKK